jgi:hypothetical protein
MKINSQDFNENGFLIIRDVFTKEEVEKFRKLSSLSLQQDIELGYATHVTKGHKDVYYCIGDLLTKPLSELLLDERILKISSELLGSRPVHFGESNYVIGIGDRGFHRDSVDRQYPIGPEWADDYHLIRVGVYLQDHDQYSGGLKVQVGSHKNGRGKRILLDSKAGDVVVWDLRTYHSGNSVRLKFFQNLPLGCRIENRLPGFVIKEEQIQRMACFMVFGAQSHHLDRHIEKHYKVKFKEYIEIQKYSTKIIEQCKNANLEIIIPEL